MSLLNMTDKRIGYLYLWESSLNNRVNESCKSPGKIELIEKLPRNFNVNFFRALFTDIKNEFISGLNFCKSESETFLIHHSHS